ncbi:hypothetical protein Aduo_004893 [Ancylostoma duodenale]
MPNLPAARVNRSRPFQKLGSKLSTSDLVNEDLCKQGVSLEFLTPLSPWKSDFYERLLGLFKSAFRKCVAQSILPLSQRQTIVAEIEAILNSRPSTSLLPSADAVPLRSIDFISPEVTLQLNIPGAQKEFNYSPQGSTQESLVIWHRETLVVLERFWAVWHLDYLSALAERHQSHVSQGRSTPLVPEVGHLLIMADDNLPRGAARNNRESELHSDRNNIVRTAAVRTAKGKPSGSLLIICTHWKLPLLEARNRLNLVLPPYLIVALSHHGPQKLLFLQKM